MAQFGFMLILGQVMPAWSGVLAMNTRKELVRAASTGASVTLDRKKESAEYSREALAAVRAFEPVEPVEPVELAGAVDPVDADACVGLVAGSGTAGAWVVREAALASACAAAARLFWRSARRSFQ